MARIARTPVSLHHMQAEGQKELLPQPYFPIYLADSFSRAAFFLGESTHKPLNIFRTAMPPRTFLQLSSLHTSLQWQAAMEPVPHSIQRVSKTAQREE